MAMLLVFWYHIWEFAGYPHFALHVGSRSFDVLGNAGLGASGVDVFMVLSGFCLFFPFCAAPDRLHRFNLKTYVFRRLRRIVPPYYAAIIYALALRAGIAAILHWKDPSAAWPSFPSAFDIAAHLTFTHTLFASTFYGITGAFWSLGLEAQFYVVFPLVIWAVARFGLKTLGALVVVSFAYYALAHWLGMGEVREVQNFFLGRWMQFAIGMMVAVEVARRQARQQTTSVWVGAGLVALAGILFVTPMPDFAPLLSDDALRGFALSVSAGALLLAICTSTLPVSFLWSNRLSARLGLMSYSFFLIHQPTMQYLAQFLKKFVRLEGIPLFCILASGGLLLCLVISYWFFRLFEKPFLNNSYALRARIAP